MKFKGPTYFCKWISNGVVDFSKFGISNQKKYNCKMAIKMLQGQYPQIYTKKFKVTYLDFNDTANRFKSQYLTTIPRGNQILCARIIPTAKFEGINGVTFSMSLHYGYNKPTVADNSNSIVNYHCSYDVSTHNGVFTAAPLIYAIGTSTGKQYVTDLLNDSEIYLSANANYLKLLSYLTAGEAYIWITYIRMS